MTLIDLYFFLFITPAVLLLAAFIGSLIKLAVVGWVIGKTRK